MKKVTRISENTSDFTARPKLRVAAYCRVSTETEKQLESLDTQIKHYKSYIKSNPYWDFAGLYYDEGITGTKKEKRPELLRMIADCKNKKIDFIVTSPLADLQGIQRTVWNWSESCLASASLSISRRKT